MRTRLTDGAEMYIYNARIFTMDGDEPFEGFVCLKDGKIAEVGKGSPKEVSPDDIDCMENFLFPGFIDCHSHIGMIGDGAGCEGEDVNEDTDPVTPHIRSIDGLNFRDGYFRDAQRAGVTCCVTGCGSANPVGGDLIAVKTFGRCADEMLIRRVAIKFALGENPKSVYRDRDETPVTRMASAAIIREALLTAKRYAEDIESAEDGDKPDFDMKSEALLPLLKREIQAHFHCHRADDIMTAVRIAEEFDLDYVLIHCTEGHLIADILGEKKARAVVGPIISDRGKPELANASVSDAAILFENGVKTAICTDCPELPVEYLPLSAAICAKAGLGHDEALRAITVNPAEIAGISDRVGRIKKGLDADLVVLDGDPLDLMTNVLLTVTDGKIVYKR